MNDVIKNLSTLFDAAYEENMNGHGNDITRMVTTFIPDAIQNLNAYEGMFKNDTETVCGEWLPVYHNGRLTGGECSVCGKYKRTYNVYKLYKSYKFCHGCGAKMIKIKKSE